MARKNADTRSFVRFKSGIGTNVLLTPPYWTDSVLARLLDVNKAGGVGLFVPLKSLSNIPLSSIFASWKVVREVKDNPIALKTEFFNVIPMTVSGERGIRVSGRVIQDKAETSEKTGFPTPRRQAKRIKLKPHPVILTRRSDRLDGEMFNVANNDGAGVLFSKDGVRDVTWEKIFAVGWKTIIAENTFIFYIKRLGMFNNQLIVGGEAPGISQNVTISKKDAHQAPGSRPAEAVSKDEELIKFLDEFMEGKHDPSADKTKSTEDSKKKS
ncbi:MAG: hypothetical protein JKX97_08850 [Candidatus Lindowbacteria bacterium]|nr:hypothetical protein [Candidatus Lindowbacteria bacterium]